MITLLGWLGAGFAVVSYAQTRTARLRQLSLVASLSLLIFNVLMRIWSNVALESVLGLVNAYRLVQLGGRRKLRRGDDARNDERIVDCTGLIS